MHYFGDNFVTEEETMELSEYWYSNSVAGDSQMGCRSLLKWRELGWTWKLPSRAQSNF